MLAATQGRCAMDGGEKAGHVPVMPEEVAKALIVDRHGHYVDATFGRGGHARRLLAGLSRHARLLVLDRDAEAIANAATLAAEDRRVRVRRGKFGALAEHLAESEVRAPVGILFDVGVSSPQLDDAERGFSFSADGPLDMRMDQRDGTTAGHWLNRAPERELAAVIQRYGEDFHARRLARAIVRARPLYRTLELAEVVARAIPAADRNKHAATRVFQAVRIHVNDELGELARGLEAAFAGLEPGGRLAALTFHGLEHRLVRRVFRQWVEGPPLPRHLPVRDLPKPVARRVSLVGRGMRPSAAEVDANPRARSALLQVVEKIAHGAPPSGQEATR